MLDFILHFDKYLSMIIQDYGMLTYVILFAIIFFETGVVVTPFLPGDSLLFVAGALSALKLLNVYLLFVILSIAAILGDSVNYFIGNKYGTRAFKKLIKEEHLKKTHEFYEKHGSKTIVLARFVPIVRTFAPFVAGIGKMSYGKFISYNVIGGILWVALFLFAGYFFGNVPIVKENLTLVILGIIVISILPGVYHFIKHKSKSKGLKSK